MIKELAQLKDSRPRRESGRFLIEGAREIERAILGGVELERALIHQAGLKEPEKELLSQLVSRKVRVTELAALPFQKLAYRENPGGLIVVAKYGASRLADLVIGPGEFILVAVEPEKPGNLGAMARSAQAAGAAALIQAGGSFDPGHPNAIRASAGAVFTLPLAGASEKEVWDWLEAGQFQIAATSPAAATQLWQADLRGKLALVVGPEDRGLSPLWLAKAPLRLKIPMHPRADSLNVSVAAALVLYEAARQREAFTVDKTQENL